MKRVHYLLLTLWEIVTERHNLSTESFPVTAFDVVSRVFTLDLQPIWAYGTLDTMQAANLAGFRASEDPRFEAGIPDFMNGILNFSIHFNVVHRKVDWQNPEMKSLDSMPAMYYPMSRSNLYRYLHKIQNNFED